MTNKLDRGISYYYAGTLGNKQYKFFRQKTNEWYESKNLKTGKIKKISVEDFRKNHKLREKFLSQ